MANKLVPGMGFHHLALRAKDFDRSFEFYTKGLGCELRLCWGEGEGRIALVNLGDGGCMEIFAGSKGEPTGMFWHVAFKTTSTDAAYAAAVAAGAVTDKPPFDAVLKGEAGEIHARIAFVKGPDGETLEFFQEQ